MKKRFLTRASAITATLLALILLVASTAKHSIATEVWSDDFEDGNYQGWVTPSSYTVSEGVLRANRPSAIIFRESTVSVGTWSFDLFHVLPCNENTYVFFMSSEPEEPLWVAYAIEVGVATRGDLQWPIYKLRVSSPDSNQENIPLTSWEILASHDGSPGEFGWFRFAVTRDQSGLLSVFVNGTLVMQTVDTQVDVSEYFGMILHTDRAVDNIIVSDSIDFQTSEVIEPLALLLVSGTLLVTISAFVIIRRK